VHVTLLPSQTSAVHALLSAVHVVPFALYASAGQVALAPLQVSAKSHSPAEARHCVPEDLNVQVAEQQEPVVPFAAPWSHCSPVSANPSPHIAALNVASAAAQLRDGLNVPSAE
jgi:hypothetical protein